MLVSKISPLFVLPVVQKALGQERAERAAKTHSVGQRENDDSFEFFAALMLIAAWAAFEAYVDDVCRAMLVRDSSLLSQGYFTQFSLTQAQQQLDQAGQREVYLRRGLQRAKDVRKPSGFAEIIDCQLELVGLNGSIPQDVADSVTASKHIRNAWAHKAGKVDQYFVDNCPGTTLAVGDEATVSRRALYDFRAGMATYAVVIVNRFRLQNGMQAAETYPGTEIAPNLFKSAADQQLSNPVSWQILRGG